MDEVGVVRNRSGWFNAGKWLKDLRSDVESGTESDHAVDMGDEGLEFVEYPLINSEERVIEEFTKMVMIYHKKAASLYTVMGRLNLFFDDYPEELESLQNTQEFELAYNAELKILTLATSYSAPCYLSGILGFSLGLLSHADDLEPPGGELWCKGSNLLGVEMEIIEGDAKLIDSMTFYRDNPMVPAETGFTLVTNAIPKRNSSQIYCIAMAKKWIFEEERIEGDDNDTSGMPREKLSRMVPRSLPMTCLLMLYLFETQDSDVVDVLTKHWGHYFKIYEPLWSKLKEFHFDWTRSIDLHTLQLRARGEALPSSSSSSSSPPKLDFLHGKLKVTHVI
jgi:hypothetical protein